jgi:hypothetical protein
MHRATAALLFFGFIGIPLFAQGVPVKDTIPFNPVGRYRVEIQSPPPRGDWSGLIVVRSVDGHYEATFSNPDGPGTYPVASVEVTGKSITITMGGEATGSVFHLTVMGDSLVGDMTSLTNRLTPVKGKRLNP